MSPIVYSRKGAPRDTMKVPFLDLKPGYAKLRKEIDAAVGAVFDQCNFVLGEPVREFEARFAESCGARHAISVASGTDAIRIALRGCGAGKGHGVITSPLTFVATAESVNAIGARPFFCDVEPASANLSPAAVRAFLDTQCGRDSATGAAIHKQTGIPITGLIPVHLYGQCADMQELNSIAREWNLFVVEDSAQSFGAEHRTGDGWVKTGRLGTAAAFSFYPSKNLGGAGDGGLITTDDDGVADLCRVLRVHGAPRAYEFTESGYNSRLDTLQAAVLLVKLAHMDETLAERKQKALFYMSLFREYAKKAGVRVFEAADLDAPAPDGSGFLVLPSEAPNCRHTHNSFNIRTADRAGLISYLAEQGVGTNVYYPKPLHLAPVFEFLGYKAGAMPVAERICDVICALPMFPEITEDQQTYVVEKTVEFLKTH